MGTRNSIRYVEAYANHPVLGLGYRVFFVLAEGRKWVRLMDAASLMYAKISREDFDTMRPEPMGAFEPARTARRLRARYHDLKRCHASPAVGSRLPATRQRVNRVLRWLGAQPVR